MIPYHTIQYKIIRSTNSFSDGWKLGLQPGHALLVAANWSRPIGCSALVAADWSQSRTGRGQLVAKLENSFSENSKFFSFSIFFSNTIILSVHSNYWIQITKFIICNLKWDDQKVQANKWESYIEIRMKIEQSRIKLNQTLGNMKESGFIR